MSYIKRTNNSYHDAWRFIEDYLPNYYQRDDVLMDDILLRYIENDGVSEDGLKWIESEYHCDKKLVREEIVRLESGFMAEALQAYYDFQTQQIGVKQTAL